MDEKTNPTTSEGNSTREMSTVLNNTLAKMEAEAKSSAARAFSLNGLQEITRNLGKLRDTEMRWLREVLDDLIGNTPIDLTRFFDITPFSDAELDSLYRRVIAEYGRRGRGMLPSRG